MPKHSFSSDSLAPASLELCAADYSAARMLTDVSDSPSDHIAAPSNTTSLSRNCPGNAERAGKPPRLGSHPGVENKNESVVRNITTARALPTVDVFGDHGRRAIKMAMATSTTPILPKTAARSESGTSTPSMGCAPRAAGSRSPHIL